MPPPPPVAAAPHPAINYAQQPLPLPQATGGALHAAVSLAPRSATAPFPLATSDQPATAHDGGPRPMRASLVPRGSADWDGTVVGAAVHDQLAPGEALHPMHQVAGSGRGQVDAPVPTGSFGEEHRGALLGVDSPSRKRARPAGAGAVAPQPGEERVDAEHREKGSKTSLPTAPAMRPDGAEGESAPVWATQS